MTAKKYHISFYGTKSKQRERLTFGRGRVYNRSIALLCSVRRPVDHFLYNQRAHNILSLAHSLFLSLLPKSLKIYSMAAVTRRSSTRAIRELLRDLQAGKMSFYNQLRGLPQNYADFVERSPADILQNDIQHNLFREFYRNVSEKEYRCEARTPVPCRHIAIGLQAIWVRCLWQNFDFACCALYPCRAIDEISLTDFLKFNFVFCRSTRIPRTAAPADFCALIRAVSMSHPKPPTSGDISCT